MNPLSKLALAFCFSLSATLGAVSAVAAQEYTPPPLSAYGTLPDIQDAALSPSGRRTATIATIEGQRLLLALDAQNKILTTFKVDDMKIRAIRWIDEERILLTYGTTRDLGYEFVEDKAEFTVAVIIPMDNSKKVQTVFESTSTIVNTIRGFYGLRQIDGRWYGFFGGLELQRGRGSSRTGTFFKHNRPLLYRVDLETNSIKKVGNEAPAGHSRYWELDANGEIAAIYEIDAVSGEWTIRNSSFDVITRGKSKTADSGISGLGRDGTTLIFFKREGENEDVRYEVPLAGGEPQLFMPDIKPRSLFFDRRTGHLTGYREELESKPIFFNEALAAPVRKVESAFRRSEDLRFMEWSDDYNHFIVRTTGVQDSGTWYAVDVNNLSAKAIAYERMAIGPEHVGKFSTFEYTASDGLELDGILTVPPGREPKNLPLVMLPHGGPAGYDFEQFDWWAQAFASRGYAVFQPNFRGSTNRDLDFMMAGYGEWGAKMQTDKSDAITALAEAGIVDPSRACIVGASYGGYAALAGVILQKNLYRCAVAVAPVTDIARIYRDGYGGVRTGRSVAKNVLRRQLGDPSTFSAVSPEKNAGRANAPIMLIHGKDDTVVPFDHSERMADALKDAGKEHEFVQLEGEDHWLSLSATRQQMLEATMRFVQEHNPAD